MKQSNDPLQKTDIDEFKIALDIKEIIKFEIEKLKKRSLRDYDDIALLEKLTKIYAVLKDDIREDVKADLWKKLGFE